MKFDLTNDTFERKTRVHDWRNYVPESIQERWLELDEESRALVAEVAEDIAAREEWE